MDGRPWLYTATEGSNPVKVMGVCAFVGHPMIEHSGDRGGGLGCSTPPPEIPKVIQNRAKLNPIVKTVKNC